MYKKVIIAVSFEFHDHNRELKIIVPINMQITDNLPSSPPFQNVQRLIITFEVSTSTIWQNIREFGK
jgi:hypothetical protein